MAKATLTDKCITDTLDLKESDTKSSLGPEEKWSGICTVKETEQCVLEKDEEICLAVG